MNPDDIEVLNIFLTLGVSEENIQIVDGAPRFNREGYAEFFIGAISFGMATYFMPSTVYYIMERLFDLLENLHTGKSILSGEMEGEIKDFVNITKRETVRMMCSIYEGRTVVMGVDSDFKDDVDFFNERGK